MAFSEDYYITHCGVCYKDIKNDESLNHMIECVTECPYDILYGNEKRKEYKILLFILGHRKSLDFDMRHIEIKLLMDQILELYKTFDLFKQNKNIIHCLKEWDEISRIVISEHKLEYLNVIPDIKKYYFEGIDLNNIFTKEQQMLIKPNVSKYSRRMSLNIRRPA